MADTAKVILLYGNKYKKAESAEHIIKFPGGSISVCRTSNNEYWAHIEVNKGQVLEDMHRESAHGDIIESRLDYEYPGRTCIEIPDMEHLAHLAVRIRICPDS